jgi:hypothetical protein
MAVKSKTGSGFSSTHKVKSKVNRPGIHSKKKSSNHKRSKNYVKKYRGQGR